MSDQSTPIAPYTRIRYLGVGDITFYAVTDDDLRAIERGGEFQLPLPASFLRASLPPCLLAPPPESLRSLAPHATIRVHTSR
jgi:hypothetical protein